MSGGHNATAVASAAPGTTAVWVAEVVVVQQQPAGATETARTGGAAMVTIEKATAETAAAAKEQH